MIDQSLDAVGVHEPGFDDSGWAPASIVDDGPRRSSSRAPSEPVRVIDGARDEHRATRRPPAARLRPEHLGLGAARRPRLARGTSSPSATPRCSSRRARCTPRRCARRRPPTSTRSPPTASTCSSRCSPSTASATPTSSGAAEVVSATAVAISSDLAPAGTSARRDPALDRFHSNVLWSQRDNFVSVPTDCPQRDERLGWTGDAQAFAATANTLLNTEAFWMSWLRDLEIDQTDEGGVPSVVPDIIRHEDMLMGGTPTDNMGRAGWADAATIVPLAVYESYGSTEVLERQLDSMRRWVAHLRRRAGRRGRAADGAVPVRRLARPGCPGRPAVGGQGVERLRRQRVLRALGAAARAGRAPRRRRRMRRRSTTRLADAVAAATWERWGEEAVSTQTGAALALEFRIAPGGAPGRHRRRPRRERRAARTAASPPASSARPSCCSRSRTTGTSPRPTAWCCGTRRRRGSTRSTAARPRCGSAGTPSCPTAPSTAATWMPATAAARAAACSRSTTTPTAR